MRTTTKPCASRIIAWLRDTWAELDYAQRRMIELNMATPALRTPPGRSMPARRRTRVSTPRVAEHLLVATSAHRVLAAFC